MLKDSIKELVKELQKASYEDLLQSAGIDQLLAAESLALIRSAKQSVLEQFLNILLDKKYRGTLHIIGREEDKKYLQQYDSLKIELYAAPGQQRYSLENTQQFLKKFHPAAICFLYQTRLHDDCENLLQILQQMKCQRYAVSNRMAVSKIINLETYIAGRQLYQDLCSWHYLKKTFS